MAKVLEGFRQHQSYGNVVKSTTPQSKGEKADDIWSSLLDGVANGKRLPEKTVLVLGGSPELQEEYLGILGSHSARRQNEKHRRRPPIANKFALGYTYQEVLDADQEDLLARLSIHLLSEPSLDFASLLIPVFTARNVPDTLLVILLDWAEPWNWARQLRDWIRLLRATLEQVDVMTQQVMEQLMQDWRKSKRGSKSSDASGNSGSANEGSAILPLGPGEWDEALGLPLCVVCHNSDNIDYLEKENGWREENFDFIQQFLRTILMKHGASLVYSSSTMPNSLPSLTQSMLDIHSLIKPHSLKPNYTEREHVLIPPNWDTWGKILHIGDGFDRERVSKGWSVDIRLPDEDGDMKAGSRDHSLRLFEDTVLNPKSDKDFTPSLTQKGLEVEVPSHQAFLASQEPTIARMKADEEKTKGSKDPRSTAGSATLVDGEERGNSVDDRSRVHEHIGPVHFNMGGIEVDAEDMVQRLKDRDVEGTPDKNPPAVSTPEGKSQNEALSKFFADLISKRGASNSPRASSQS